MAAYTTKANLEEALTLSKKARWVSTLSRAKRDVAELDAADHAKMIQQFRVRQRALQTAGLWPGDTDLGDSQRGPLDSRISPATVTKCIFPKLLKDGRPLRGKTKVCLHSPDRSVEFTGGDADKRHSRRRDSRQMGAAAWGRLQRPLAKQCRCTRAPQT